MALRVTISDRFNAPLYADADHMLSIVDPDRDLAPLSCARTVMRFKDLGYGAVPDAAEVARARLAGERIPESEDVTALFRLAVSVTREASRRDFHLHIHCEGGISRSTAAGVIVLTTWLAATQPQMDLSARLRRAVAMVSEIRPPALPNFRIAQLADDLQYGGRLVAELERAFPAAECGLVR